MDALEQLWECIEAAIQLQAPPHEPILTPGASEQAIADIERELGVMLPEDVRASYRRHDGGFSLEPVIYMDMSPLAEMAESWHILTDLLRDEEWANQPPYYFSEVVVRSGWQTGPIQPVWWNRRWIPFASELAGNLLCIDLAPAPGGTIGQIIDWDHECGPSRVLFPSFEHLLTSWSEQLEAHGNAHAE